MLSRTLPAMLIASAVLSASAFAGTIVTDSTTLGTTNFSGKSKILTDAQGTGAVVQGLTGDGTLPVDGDGIYLSGVGDIIHITFSKDVLLTSYTIGYAEPGVVGNIEFYVGEDGDSIFSTGITAGLHNLPSSLPVGAGLVLTINGNVDDISQLKSFTFETVAGTFGLGDVNGDHIVDQLDLNLVTGHWQQSGVGLANGDANLDGIVDQLDLNDVTGHWQQSTAGRSGLAVVPEPSTIALLSLGTLTVLRTRKTVLK